MTTCQKIDGFFIHRREACTVEEIADAIQEPQIMVEATLLRMMRYGFVRFDECGRVCKVRAA